MNIGNRWGALALLLIIALIFIAFFVLVDIQAVIVQLLSANRWTLALASISLIGGLIAFAARWRALLNNKPALRFTFHASNIGHAANILIPGRAGEAIRILVMGSDENVSMTESGSSFVVERLFEQLMRLLTLLLAVLFGAGLSVSPISILGGFGFILAGALIILWLINHPETTVEKGSAIIGRLPRVSPESARQSAADLLDNLSAVAQPAQFARVMLLSLVTWALFWGFFYLTLLSLADGFPAEDSLAISLGALALSPPSAPTQPGLFHASIVVPLSAVGFEAATLTAYAVLLHILEMVWMIGFGLWGMLATGFTFAKLRSARTKEP